MCWSPWVLVSDSVPVPIDEDSSPREVNPVVLVFLAWILRFWVEGQPVEMKQRACEKGFR